ncbi:MAG TPA: glycosyltransferase [Anaerolineales bacterium]|nr:glycosyltransferase [Anaerolineales bacterium]
MRIAYLAQSYPPMVSGAAIVAEKLASEMAERGHQVLVLAASDKDQPYITLQENLTVLRLRSTYNPLRVGQRFLLFPRRAVLQALEEFQPDFIHSHEPLQMGWLGLTYARRTRIPITLTVHQLPGFVSSYLPKSVRPIVEKSLWTYASWLLRQFTTIITPTRSISTFIQQMTGLDVNVISCGLDLQTFHPPLSADDDLATRQKWNLPWPVPLILHVGRLDTEKHADRVILAAAQTLRQTDAHLVVVGDGRQKKHLIQLCHDLGFEERVHFTGYVSVEQGLPELYRMATVFVTASEIETQGIVLLEAAASGLPLVAVNATCIPEIVYDGANGYLTKSGDTHAMSRSLTNILRDPQLAACMGRVSRALAEGHPNQETFDEHERIYQKMITEKGSQKIPVSAKTYFHWKQLRDRSIWLLMDRFR